MTKFFTLAIPTPPVYEPGAGVSYATTLAEASQRLSFLLVAVGWFLIALSALLALAGSTAGTTASVEVQEMPDKRVQIIHTQGVLTVLRTHEGLVCSAFAIICGALGWQSLDRSSSATMVATVATEAIGIAGTDAVDADRQAFAACIKAKSSWLAGRMNFDRIEVITKSMSKSEST